MTREAGGIVADVKGLAATGVRAVRTRLELLAIEVSEEKEWALRFLAITVTSLYLASFGLLLAVLALAAWVDPEHRPAVLAGFALVFLVAGGSGIAFILNGASRRNPPLADTIAVLKGDEKALRDGLGATGD